MLLKQESKWGRSIQEIFDPAQEQVVTNQNVTEQAPNLAIPYLESRNTTKKQKVEGAVGQVLEHLDKTFGRNPEFPNPNEQDKKDWKKQIEKHVKNIKKEAAKLKKDPKKVIQELVQKGKLEQEKIIKAYEELKRIGVDF